MQAETRLSDSAAAEIAALEKDGIALTPAEIVHLQALALEVETPQIRLKLARGTPVFVAGVPLWPLTLFAEDWFKREGLTMPGRHSDYALGYAMANAYDSTGRLETGGKEARAAVDAWRKTLRCTLAQFQEALAQVLVQDSKPPIPQNVDDTPLSDGEFSVILASLTKSDPEIWERRCSIGYARAVLAALFMQSRADGQPSIYDPSIQAELALGFYSEQIRKSRQNDSH